MMFQQKTMGRGLPWWSSGYNWAAPAGGAGSIPGGGTRFHVPQGTAKKKRKYPTKKKASGRAEPGAFNNASKIVHVSVAVLQRRKVSERGASSQPRRRQKLGN